MRDVAPCRRLQPLVELSELATLVLVARRLEQINGQGVAALVPVEAALEPPRTPLGAERCVVANAPLAFVRHATIERRLAQLLELEPLAMLAGGLLRAGGFSALALVARASLGPLLLELLGALARAVVVTHGTPLLGAVTHQARGAVLRLRAPAKQQALGGAALGFGFETLTGDELVAPRCDAPRECDPASVRSCGKQSPEHASQQSDQ